ncbi:MAG: T9SS type A sorting domain-containing protein [Crocinitomicaceae bacterium]|nr:T9SS type A sorting domain-containing protein [Crocinitomicaceae bacterium]MDP4799464.1 T9SS type A sorting domain-containing protein [Crocinitomicaceae bacterium]MDP4868984.1 T9SS type A sorting domain-containing protein [Crocinitomicaceae bacterium]MDP4955226.1 T9SS type A sorting domain-containing protein [Crocinitomicaceae bacterium]MDP5067092.1 T9SS type A sorting domain-containing protein [Crocinitomicaceae bacterium]
MKTIYLLLFGFFAFSQLSFAQVTGFAINGLSLGPNVVTTSCDSTLSIGFSAVNPATNSTSYFDLPYVITGNNFTGFQFQAVVDWGDGATSNSGGGTSTTGTNISMNPPLNHTYSTSGTYTVTTTVYNPANQTYAYDSIQYTVGFCNYQLYAFVGLDCDNNGTVEQSIPNAPFQLIGSNGQIYQDTIQNNMLIFSNLQSGVYNLQLDPQWLAANGYQVQSSFPSNTINIPSPGATTYSFTLICNQGLTQLCVGGTVFCDANQNGIFELNETTLSNVPIVVNGITSYSNTLGQYNISFTGVSGQYYPLQINSNYLANSMNTISVSALDSVLAYPCTIGAPPIPTNIPFNCNSQSPTFCYGGFVFCDANGNGVMNVGEAPIAGAQVQLFTQPNSTTSVTVYTDSTGYFSYCGPFSGTSNIILAQVSPTWLIYNGFTGSTSYTSLQGFVTAQVQPGMIAVNCGGTTTAPCADLWTTVTPWIGYYQNSTAYIKINWGSYGPGIIGNYTLSFTYPAGVSPILSSIQNPNYTISGNTITWNLNSAASSFSNYDVILFSVPGGLINGAQHFFTSSIAPTGATIDCGTYNNTGSLLQILGNSYDPNDKNASTDYMNENYPLGYLDAFIDDALTYTIRFQNTGTAPAQNIYIIDTLSAQLDWSSFTLLEATHPIQVVNLGNGIMRFEFNQIWLPDSTSNEPQSHGHLTYRISENANNPIMSTIENTAYIYFDWNDPIITNTTFHQNMWLDQIDELNGSLAIYPNPAQTQISLGLTEPSQVLIKDINGKVIFNELVGLGQTINIQAFESGVYLIEGAQQKGKFIKF